jgi:hypothetical protein
MEADRIARSHLSKRNQGDRLTGFHHHFREDLRALGLPAPASLFANLPSALAAAQRLLALVDKLGTGATVNDVARAGSGLEPLGEAGAVPASYYMGALIGGLARACAAGRGRGMSLTYVLAFASTQGLNRAWLGPMLAANPRFYSAGGRA